MKNSEDTATQYSNTRHVVWFLKSSVSAINLDESREGIRVNGDEEECVVPFIKIIEHFQSQIFIININAYALSQLTLWPSCHVIYHENFNQNVFEDANAKLNFGVVFSLFLFFIYFDYLRKKGIFNKLVVLHYFLSCPDNSS